ncbi:SurA-like protein [Natranaerovirga pectinivora]|uniref:SurA-like protein n=1 Tax=Natranaerovirga pectinivora TaxID=682400 RepID=A0A4V2V0F7_9FIRM|nr:SurA N-terminal domain-containing protein [Natranaerovirga pectinivora]TCT15710.1 SurA-like protein [Natranaerovirga pectinivora]
MNNKKILFFIIALIAVLMVGCADKDTNNTVEPNGNVENGSTEISGEYDESVVVAIVNGVEITNKEFMPMYLKTKLNYEDYGYTFVTEEELALLEELKGTILENLIHEEVLFQEATRSGHTVTDDRLSREIDMIKLGFASDAEYQEALISEGLTEADLKEIIRRDIVIGNYFEEVLNVSVTEEEILEMYYELKELYEEMSEGMEEPFVMPELAEIRDELSDEIMYNKEMEELYRILDGLMEKSDVQIL